MYRNLTAWQKSYHFALDVYKATKTFPKEETYGVVSQIRRAATSIPVNIAEGKMRRTDSEFKQFLCIARGSMTEVEVWLEFSRDLGSLNDQQFTNLRESCGEVGKLINGLIKSI